MNLRSDTARKIAYALARSRAVGWQQKSRVKPLLSPDEYAKENFGIFLLEANSLLPDPLQHVPNCCPCCGEAGEQRMSDTNLRCTNPLCNVQTFKQTLSL